MTARICSAILPRFVRNVVFAEKESSSSAESSAGLSDESVVASVT